MTTATAPKAPGPRQPAPRPEPPIARAPQPEPKPRPGPPPQPTSNEDAASGTGVLRINSRPWSKVLVDGRMVGNTPQMNLVLGAGRHTVTLVNPDFGLQRVLAVTIKAGEVNTKIVELAEAK
jgi:hypothetical protein